jgi:hypothetical protein
MASLQEIKFGVRRALAMMLTVVTHGAGALGESDSALGHLGRTIHDLRGSRVFALQSLEELRSATTAAQTVQGTSSLNALQGLAELGSAAQHLEDYSNKVSYQIRELEDMNKKILSLRNEHLAISGDLMRSGMERLQTFANDI